MKILLFSVACVFMFGCEKKGTEEKITGNKDNFNVEFLFQKDECKVYRFKDDGRNHYFTNCNGETMTVHSYQCGKSRCHFQENIGGKKDGI